MLQKWKQEIDKWYNKEPKKARNRKALIDIKQTSLEDFNR